MTSPTDELPTLPTGYRWRLFEKRMGSYGDCFGLRIQQKRLTRMNEWVRPGSRPTGIVWGYHGQKRFLWRKWDVYVIDRVDWVTVAEIGPSSKTLIELRTSARIILRDAWARGHDLKEARAVLQ